MRIRHTGNEGLPFETSKEMLRSPCRKGSVKLHYIDMGALHVLTFFVPPEYRETVLAAIFDAGAGSFGAYERCAFVCSGEGRFRPRPGAAPFLGMAGKDERVAEDRVECVVADEFVEAVLLALRKSHPYEEPAIYLTRLDDRAVSRRFSKEL